MKSPPSDAFGKKPKACVAAASSCASGWSARGIDVTATDGGADRAHYVELRAAVAPFERSGRAASASQLAVTLVLFVAHAGLLVRLFIFQHDCGHGAYFASSRANRTAGIVCSVFTLTPYENWRRQHARHHGNWNNLDRRAAGVDIYGACLTVREYRA